MASADDKVIDAPWLHGDETRALIAALGGKRAVVRFVGGCVRDTVLGRPVRDIDVATTETPQQVMARLAAAGIKAIPTGIEHGTVTAVIGPRHFEVTTLRHDVETFGRRARVAFTDDWLADARRRDFTINALYCDPDGTLYDPLGGAADLARGVVRFIGDAGQRIHEDALRILRFFRFYAWFGEGAPDAPSLAACGKDKALIDGLSGERVAAELARLFAAPDPLPALGAMRGAGVLAVVLPEAGDFALLRGLTEVDGADPDPWRRLMAIIDGDARAVGAMARRLRLSRRLSARLVAIARPRPELTPGKAKKALYRLRPEHFVDRAFLAWAATPDDKTFAEAIALAGTWQPPRLPVTGDDIKALGVAEGARIGEILKALEDWWVDNDFPTDEAAIRQRLRALVDRQA